MGASFQPYKVYGADAGLSDPGHGDTVHVRNFVAADCASESAASCSTEELVAAGRSVRTPEVGLQYASHGRHRRESSRCNCQSAVRLLTALSWTGKTPFENAEDRIGGALAGRSGRIAEGYSWKTLQRTSLRIRQGTGKLVPKVRRLVQGSNRRWEVKVTPSSKDDIAVGIGPSPVCTDAAAMCTSGDTAVSNAIGSVIKGPPGLSVADARVQEAAGATVDFAVTLGRAAAGTVTVDYATSDGTATAGSDRAYPLYAYTH